MLKSGGDFMNISSIYPNYPSGNSAPQQSAGVDSKIQSLEQKLQKLETEKQKATQRKDEEQKEKLEKQIQEIEKQIQQLRKQENEEVRKAESNDAHSEYPQPECVSSDNLLLFGAYLPFSAPTPYDDSHGKHAYPPPS